MSYSDGSSPLSGDEEMFAFGTNVTLACNDGFVLVGGDGVRTCGDEGEWSGQESTCVWFYSIVIIYTVTNVATRHDLYIF